MLDVRIVRDFKGLASDVRFRVSKRPIGGDAYLRLRMVEVWRLSEPD